MISHTKRSEKAVSPNPFKRKKRAGGIEEHQAKSLRVYGNINKTQLLSTKQRFYPTKAILLNLISAATHMLSGHAVGYGKRVCTQVR
jgi:hypothetical protein